MKWVLLFLILLCSAGALASALAPADTCRVLGVVESVRFEAAKTWCKEPGVDCPTDGPTGRPDQYVYSLIVQSAETVESAGFLGRACDDFFVSGAAVTILVPLSMSETVAAPRDTITFSSVENAWNFVANGPIMIERSSGFANDWRPPRERPLLLWIFLAVILLFVVGIVLTLIRKQRQLSDSR